MKFFERVHHHNLVNAFVHHIWSDFQSAKRDRNNRKTFKVLWSFVFYPLLTLSVPQDVHGCTQPFFIYAQNIMVYNLTAHNYVSLKDNPNKVYIKLKGIGYTI